ncbi:MAG: hypothetical protein IT308_12195 [Anaerolineaceae bacterium]|nr:hypothetical protein [Anaerolineaceae bacterium]
MKSRRQLFTGFVLLAVLTVACACPISLSGLNPLSGIEETGMAIASELPGGLLETAGAYATEAGVSPEDIMKTIEVGVDDFSSETTGEPPKDIPIVEGEVSIQVSSPTNLVYTVKLAAEDVKNFYQGQMPAYGWKQEDAGVQIPGIDRLSYSNDQSQVLITIMGTDNTTQVLIEVKAK